ncbi:GNAT family N-acetyltransferase [Xenorhabdus sp. XENO-10]|uniref:GNAT family N-acetyltransferase n=1 Tax=Xenorhabdus yunnanensis TaxID=3025878 RepID=A0ABT5LCI3_9GAMM|nr:GNAT family N-acetyltransferase [Xenorhabdus yunnanensis]MDC9588211.1 GNAT family N-acetyltransferase [Xenorhabdus yunnanensis]
MNPRVFIIDEHQKKGLERWLVECILQYPVIPYVQYVTLVTSMAGWLYEKLGFSPVVE